MEGASLGARLCSSIWLTATTIIIIFLLCSCCCNLQLNQYAAAAACDYSQHKCGNLSIPYPFGMEDTNCGLPEYYRIICKKNSSLAPHPMAFLSLGGIFESQLNVMNFSAGALILNATQFRAGSCDQHLPGTADLTIPHDAPFFVGSSNVFAAIGCHSSGKFAVYLPSLATSSSPTTSECSSSCFNAYNYNYCKLFGCCALPLPGANFQSINITGAGIGYKDLPGTCGFSTVLDPSTYENPNVAVGIFGAGQWGVRLRWGVPYPDDGHKYNCATINSNAAYACTQLSQCIEVQDGQYYACNCTPGYRGDGFQNGTRCEDIDECAEHLDNCVGPPLGKCTNLPGSFTCSCVDGAVGNGIDPHRSTNGKGCTDIDECASEDLNNCVGSPYGKCINLLGSFTCSCVDGGVGDGIDPHRSTNGTGCTYTSFHEKYVKTSIIIVGTALPTATAVAVACLVAWWVSRRQSLKARRDENFENNGGKALMEILSKGGGDILRVFSEGELKKATQNFAEDLQLGSGGYGTVYKGLLGDGTIVAIKRSNHMEEGEAHEFINEVVILSQVNHRNIVNLLGCCLETPVPLLVYEYIPNGTLTEHLHGKDGRLLSWETRLQIALESAEALLYLHSSISTPVFHRDVKSSNILLDNTLTPKIADFGISRLHPKDQSHVSTLAHGTLGYLDPEYFLSFQLTDKSDVYSYGVVLLELITSLKPIDSQRRQNEVNLPVFCLARWKEGTFSAVIDPRMLVSEDSHAMNSINAVASVAFACLRLHGQKRPSMKLVFQELLSIRGSVADNAGSRAHDLILKVEDDELEALEYPFSHELNEDVTYSQKTGASIQEMEMALMGSLIRGGR